MSVLAGLEPFSVFRYFEEICQIPHGSGNIKQISDYLVNFAKERKLEHYQDEINNVIIIKEATPGYEAAEPVMIQGHMDMVAVSDEDADIDMTKEGLRLAIDGDEIYAKGTSLGGDDGIAVAYALALLDAKEIEHPRLEVVITVDEEVGMDGACAIDLSVCKAKKMLNIDSEEEGYLLTSCAGGASVIIDVPMERRTHEGDDYTLTISGLMGGHSGVEIDKERGNANVILARILRKSCENAKIHVYEVNGGQKDNAIPNVAEVSFIMKEKFYPAFHEALLKVSEEIKNELQVKDPNFTVSFCKNGVSEKNCYVLEDFKKALELIIALPCGVCGMSASVKGLVETSLNLGVLTGDADSVILRYAVRSSIASQKQFLLDKMEVICKIYGAGFEVSGVYPGWAYKVDSPLRDTMVEVYKNMYGKDLIIQAIHAGLECGFFSEKIAGLDCVSFGPDMKDIHTTKERLSISSTKRVWEYLLNVLKELK